MTDPAPSFAIIPVHDKPPADAIAHGAMAAVMERVADSKVRAEAEALVKRAEQAAEQERERGQREQTIVTDGIRAIADGIAKLARRLDAIERSQATRRKWQRLQRCQK